MALTKKKVEETLGSLIFKKNEIYYIHESNVDTAIQRIVGPFAGCYAIVKPAGKVGERLVIGNAVAKIGKPLIEIIIRTDE